MATSLHSAYVDTGWLCRGGLWEVAHHQNIATKTLPSRAQRTRTVSTQRRFWAGQPLTAGKHQLLPQSDHAGARIKARAALREPAKKVRQDVEWSRGKEGRSRVLSLPPAGPSRWRLAQGGAGEIPRGRCARAAGCGCRAPRAQRAPQARSARATCRHGNANEKNATFPVRQARDNQDRLQIDNLPSGAMSPSFSCLFHDGSGEAGSAAASRA
jgi:hypothetical protein